MVSLSCASKTHFRVDAGVKLTFATLRAHARIDLQWLMATARSLSGSTLRPAGALVGFYMGDVVAIAELFWVMATMIALMAAFAASAWACHVAAGWSSSAKRWSILGLVVVWALTPFAVLQAFGPMHSAGTHFLISIGFVFGFWHLVELAFRTGPKGFDRDFRQWMTYSVAPGEVALDDEGGIIVAPEGPLGECLRSLMVHSALFQLLLAVGDRTDFVPGLPAGSDPMSMPYVGFPLSVPAHFYQTWTFCCLMIGISQPCRAVLAAMGVATEVQFRQPLLLSTGVRDFWGRRWNILVHRMMKRSAFVPCARRLGPKAGSLAAFSASGIFHEYMWVIINWKDMRYMPGGPLLFFPAQFVLLTGESLLRCTPLGRMATALPRPLQTAITLLVPMPLGCLFLQGVYAGGLMHAIAATLPRVVLA